MDPNNKKISVLAIEVGPVTVTDPKFWKWADQILDATLVTRPTRFLVTRRSGTSHIDKYFLVKINKGNVQRHGGNASGTKNPTATHCHP